VENEECRGEAESEAGPIISHSQHVSNYALASQPMPLGMKSRVFSVSIFLSVLQPRRIFIRLDFPRLNQAGEVLEGAVVGRLPFHVEAAPGEFP
jgi:hypothetical protein